MGVVDASAVLDALLDAAYVTLGEAVEAPLSTACGRLARAVGAHTHVEVVEV